MEISKICKTVTKKFIFSTENCIYSLRIEYIVANSLKINGFKTIELARRQKSVSKMHITLTGVVARTAVLFLIGIIGY